MLVADAVECEPVSAEFPCFAGNLQGKCTGNGRFESEMAQEGELQQWLAAQFP